MFCWGSVLCIFPKALRKTVFTKIFVFASFGNRRFSNFGNISVRFCKIAIFRENSRFFAIFIFASFGNRVLPKLLKLPKLTKKWRSTCLVSTLENSFRLENRLKSSAKSSECRALIFPIDKQKEEWVFRGRCLKENLLFAQEFPIKEPRLLDRS